MFVQDADEMSWFKRNFIQVLKRYSLNNYLHGVIALTLNVCVVFTATPFRLLPEQALLLWALISMLASYKYFALGYRKPYQLFEFETIFLKSKGNQAKYLTMKAEEPRRYYETILTLFKDKYPGCYFKFNV